MKVEFSRADERELGENEPEAKFEPSRSYASNLTRPNKVRSSFSERN